MKKIILILVCFAAVIGLCKGRTAVLETQEYVLAEGHTAFIFNNTITNVPEQVVKAIIRVPSQANKEYRVYILKELPSNLKKITLKNYSLVSVTNKSNFIYYKLKKNEK